MITAAAMQQHLQRSRVITAAAMQQHLHPFDMNKIFLYCKIKVIKG